MISQNMNPSCNHINGSRCPANETSREMDFHLPEGKMGLLNFIDEVSFAAYDAALYLDTHPECPDARKLYDYNNRLRNVALTEYARRYGPLTLNQVSHGICKEWHWVDQPWPWEGGHC